MSFSAQVKEELCRQNISRRCCAQAEAYGILLYCNTFHSRQVRIPSANGRGSAPSITSLPIQKEGRNASQ